jgi:hypothetical protein
MESFLGSYLIRGIFVIGGGILRMWIRLWSHGGNSIGFYLLFNGGLKNGPFFNEKT